MKRPGALGGNFAKGATTSGGPTIIPNQADAAEADGNSSRKMVKHEKAGVPVEPRETPTTFSPIKDNNEDFELIIESVPSDNYVLSPASQSQQRQQQPTGSVAATDNEEEGGGAEKEDSKETVVVTWEEEPGERERLELIRKRWAPRDYEAELFGDECFFCDD